VVDTEREHTAVKEANILNIPVMALVDTNSDPDNIDYLIPANDDAMRAIKTIVAALADAVVEGKNLRSSAHADDDEEEVDDFGFGAYDDDDDDDDDEAYLGQSTLAKLRDNKLFDDDDDDDNYDEGED